MRLFESIRCLSHNLSPAFPGRSVYSCGTVGSEIFMCNTWGFRLDFAALRAVVAALLSRRRDAAGIKTGAGEKRVLAATRLEPKSCGFAINVTTTGILQRT